VACCHDLLAHVLRIDEGRRAGDRNCFFQRPDSHVGVDVGREASVQLDSFTLDSCEALQAESDRVDPRRQIDDVVAPLAVCGDGAYAFDEDRTARLHVDAGEHRPGRVPCNPGDSTVSLLRNYRYRNCEYTQRNSHADPTGTSHTDLRSLCKMAR